MAERRLEPKRRKRQERRKRGRHRRRKGDLRSFVIELTSSELRIAQLERSSIPGTPDIVSAWVTRWRRDADSLDAPEGRAELTAALREAARQFSMSTAEVRIVLSGEYCVLRTVRGAVDEVHHELQQLEQRSRLYLALGPGDKVLVNHTRSLDARHAHAVAAACNKSTLDAVRLAAEAANLDVALIEPALSALSRAVSRLPEAPGEPYLLVNLNESATEVGVCHQGRLLLDYRPGGACTAADLPALLENHLNRLNRHVARYLRASSAGLKHVFLCGDAASTSEAAKFFRLCATLEVHEVRPADVRATWSLAPEAVESATAAALGNMLLCYLPAEEYDAPNFLQYAHDRQREPLRPRLMKSAMPLAATLLVAIGVAWANARLRKQLEGMHAEFDRVAPAARRAAELRMEIAGAAEKLAQLNQLVRTEPYRLGGNAIRNIGHCMPADVWLSQFSVDDGVRATLQGASYLEAGVYDFVRWLELAPGIDEVALRRTQASTAGAGPSTNFELDVTLDDFNDRAIEVARHE